MRARLLLAVVLSVPLVGLVACGDDAGSSSDPAPDATAADEDALVGASDAEGADVESSADGSVDASADAQSDAEASDGGLFTPGAPPTGSSELEIFAAKSELNLVSQAPIVQGDLLFWECGFQAVGIGHIWASFVLTSSELQGLSLEQQADIETNTTLRLIDQGGFIIAENEALGFGLDFDVPGRISIAGDSGAVRMILNRDVVGETTRPSNVDGELVRYQVRVPIPGGSTFVREVWVDTLVPASQTGC